MSVEFVIRLIFIFCLSTFFQTIIFGDEYDALQPKPLLITLVLVLVVIFVSDHLRGKYD